MLGYHIADEMIEFVLSLMEYIFYLPVLLINSICLFASFVIMLIISSLDIMSHVDNFILDRYTSITRRIHLPKHRTPKQFTPSICFMGGGQLWMFAIGVGHYIFKNYDIERIKFLASSSGCFAAVPLACGLDPYEWCKKDWGKCIAHFESRGILGCLYDTKHFYYNLWNDYLPEHAHEICSGKLYISVTLFPSMKNKVVSEFKSRDDLIWTIVASMCLPFAFIRDFPVKCAPEIGYCMDGGFSNDSPCLDSYTITVSALHREADIKPSMIDKKDKRRKMNRKWFPSIVNLGNISVGWKKHFSRHSTSSLSSEFHPSSNLYPDQLVDKRSQDSDSVSTGSHRSVLSQRDGKTGTFTISESSSTKLQTCPNDCVVANMLPNSKESIDVHDGETVNATPIHHLGDSLLMDVLNLQGVNDCVQPVSMLDIIRVPQFSRVWEIAGMGEQSAVLCDDFERHEWTSIRVHSSRITSPRFD